MSERIEQRYDGESAVISAWGTWLCEHQGDHATVLEDKGRTVTCPDCGTTWAPWTSGFKRLAMPVVIPGGV